MERYRSGHNGADSKSVCEQSHMGSNPILSAITGHQFRYNAYLDWCPVSFCKVLDLQGFSILFNDIRLRGVPETVAAEPFAFSPITLFNERSRGVQILVGGVHFRQKGCAHFNYSSRAQKKGRKTCSPKIRTALRPCKRT